MDEAFNLLHKVPEIVWLILANSALVSILLQVFKKKLALASPKVITLVHFVLAGVGPAVAWFQSVHVNNPAIIAVQAFVSMGVNQPIYQLLVKPTSLKLSNIASEARQRVEGSQAVEVPGTQEFAA